MKISRFMNSRDAADHFRDAGYAPSAADELRRAYDIEYVGDARYLQREVAG